MGETVNRFGRLVAPKDGRDGLYRMQAAIPQIAAVVKPTPRQRAYRDGPLLDQGETPQCVGYSSRGFLDCAPLMLKAAVGPSATAIYKSAQRLDEWAGENYEGTSVRAGMKALASAGAISGYVWGQTVAEAIAWMNGGYGTVVVGTNWYGEMSECDREGFLREPPGSMSTPLGGHAWRWIWYDPKVKAILMRNSWGPYFGWTKRGTDALSGYAWLRVALAERLLREDGEVAAATQIPIKPVAL